MHCVFAADAACTGEIRSAFRPRSPKNRSEARWGGDEERRREAGLDGGGGRRVENKKQ